MNLYDLLDRWFLRLMGKQAKENLGTAQRIFVAIGLTVVLFLNVNIYGAVRILQRLPDALDQVDQNTRDIKSIREILGRHGIANHQKPTAEVEFE